MMSGLRLDPGSFRDPDSTVYRIGGEIVRGLRPRALAEWNRLRSTDFYRRFLANGLVVASEPIERPIGGDPKCVAFLKHPSVPLVSYPYEWCFSMLQDAALLQLDLQLAALREGMTLSDATPFNIQWIGSRPVFIDVGSFTAYQPGNAWTGYSQFCQLFLYPLFLASYKRVAFHPWLRGSLDGVDVDQCRALMSPRDYLRPGVFAHVYLHAKARSWTQGSPRNVKDDLRTEGFGPMLIERNVTRLRRIVEALTVPRTRSAWSGYQDTRPYEAVDLERKERFIHRIMASQAWARVWDFGCNTGTYAQIASMYADYVIALDSDETVIDALYRTLREDRSSTLLPLAFDIANPSPSMGWRNRERPSLWERGRPSLILCLALVHHLVISRNIPLADVIEWLASFEADLVIEFVARDDAMVEQLLRNRDAERVEYSEAGFEAEMSRYFRIMTREPLSSGTRTLYHAKHARRS